MKLTKSEKNWIRQTRINRTQERIAIWVRDTGTVTQEKLKELVDLVQQLKEAVNLPIATEDDEAD